MGSRFSPVASRLAPVIICIVSAVIAAGCGQYGKVYGEDTDSGKAKAKKKRGEQLITDKPFNLAAQKAAGCSPAERNMSDRGSKHVDKAPKKYKDNPPTSGDHLDNGVEWGVYTKPKPDARWLHNLEHGNIVVAYKGLTKAQVTTLTAHRKLKPQKLLVIPRPTNPKAGVEYLAWRTRIHCAKPSPEALQYMIDNFLGDGAPKPEGSSPHAKSGRATKDDSN